MGIIENLESPNFKVTKSDKILIEYIKNNIEDVFYKPISQIAKESNIGEATITRFSKKMGFNGLQDFKVTLAQEISSLSKNKNIINSNIENNEPVVDTAKKLLISNINTLESTVDIINGQDIHKSSQLIINAKRIYFVGIGYSGIIAQDSNYKFMRIGLNCVSFDSSHTMIMMASIMEKGDLLIAISHSGETDEIIKTVKLAKENEVDVISITKKKESSLKDISDIHLEYISEETLLETGSISSKLAQIFLIDLIYTQVVKEISSEAIDRKIKTTDAIKTLKNI
ncbi:MurR/RpiR family transcriptional regulator [Paraclostridium sordellii]|uniref:MurR/RpiR family transcriptional regulator n=1 Tax=Paraclostridium sordellii TaxID=1505 RepID=UPI0003857E9E|nr:MurR/RpiR family transcriptional regulator [Paeniclostridium sordellii]EPZ55048.1 helix-turn-helix domain, rpiR family protein [[Clostridium] sordellii VPI 9048] [Paeniclostridium sordellii VPI 9048]MBS6023094.1 MurR/RpiR family transcriptional regulator [Paeniclostridium sordellii]MBX9182290.1 MurR/RpiR family transcriptional regulator [Paeniclostridium sordellii]MCH1964949.1 MurR/RpiR family transcriptional regulator [Paeniclostridium sordellii]MDU2688194.1 MurR/RpiR family transcriptiona